MARAFITIVAHWATDRSRKTWGKCVDKVPHDTLGRVTSNVFTRDSTKRIRYLLIRCSTSIWRSVDSANSLLKMCVTYCYRLLWLACRYRISTKLFFCFCFCVCKSLCINIANSLSIVNSLIVLNVVTSTFLYIQHLKSLLFYSVIITSRQRTFTNLPINISEYWFLV